MSTTQYLFAGFGGQGILFAGKFAAYKGLIEEKQVSWLPSYGPEMRGGTASCSVMGNILKVMGEFKEDSVLSALKKVISAKHADMLDVNLKALKTGAEL